MDVAARWRRHTGQRPDGKHEYDGKHVMDLQLWLAVAAIAVVLWLILRLRGQRRRKAGLPSGIPVRYTLHAKERMQERGVTAKQIELVLARPDRSESDPHENSVRLERDFDGRFLKVWVAEPWPPAGEVVIKSTAWRFTARFTIPANRIGTVIGRKGATIEHVRATTDASIHIGDDGTVMISAGEKSSVDAARKAIEALAR